ncbi:MAG: hypothetical protein ACLPYS_17365 [Vulcanimicrobiaceae bacterium]
MRRIARSEGYARARLFSAALFALLGLVIVVRTAAVVGLSATGLPAYALGGAMVALAIVRFRDYFAARQRT